jgi:hypothetical protein
MMELGWRGTRGVIVAALLTAAAYVFVVSMLLASRGGDISRFVVAGGPGVDAAAVPKGLTVIPDIGGYDGVAFYRFAVDPFSTTQTEYGITLDIPAYRHQRIGYPLLVWLLSGGRAERVPFWLVAVNVLAAIGLAAGGALLVQHFGIAPLWGMSFAFYPGFLMALSRDTSEIVASAFLVGALAAHVRQRWTVAALLLCFAVLTRETSMMVVAGLGLAYALQFRRSGRPRAAMQVFMLPMLVFAAWQAVLAYAWGAVPVRAGSPVMAAPFSEYLRFFAAAWPRRIHLQRLYFAECLFLAVIVTLAAVAVLRRNGAPLAWRLAWGGNLALASTLGPAVWGDDFAFMRVFSDLLVVSVAIIVPSNVYLRAVGLAASAGLWFYLAAHLVELG